MSKIVITNAEVKQALRKLGKPNATAKYRRKLVPDLKEIKMFAQLLSGHTNAGSAMLSYSVNETNDNETINGEQ